MAKAPINVYNNEDPYWGTIEHARDVNSWAGSAAMAMLGLGGTGITGSTGTGREEGPSAGQLFAYGFDQPEPGEDDEEARRRRANAGQALDPMRLASTIIPQWEVP